MTEASIARNAEGVPIYDGSPETLPLFREEALQYLMTFEHHKRYLAAPRLVKELQGVAKTAVRRMTTKNPEWVAHPRGVYQLLQHLEEVISKPSLVDASKYVMKFFYGMSRRRGEGMTSWISRHSEAMWEASQALRRVKRDYGPESAKCGASSDAGSSRGDGKATGPFRDDGRLAEEDDDDQGINQKETGWWESAGWQSQWQGGWSDKAWSTWTESYEPPKEWDHSTETFLPEFLVGFLLLHRSSLDANERTNILASIRGEFTPENVSKALREQWSDADIIKRDKAKMGSAYMAEDEVDTELEALMAEGEFYDPHSLDEDTAEAYEAEELRVQEAMEAIKTQKATLREARWNQKQMKLGRKFFPNKPFSQGRPAPHGRKGRHQVLPVRGKPQDCRVPTASDGQCGHHGDSSDSLHGGGGRSRGAVGPAGRGGAGGGVNGDGTGDPGRHSGLHGGD